MIEWKKNEVNDGGHAVSFPSAARSVGNTKSQPLLWATTQHAKRNGRRTADAGDV